MSVKRRPRHYFCFRSPYSWIAQRYLAERMTPSEQAQVEMVPFWEPDELTMRGLTEQKGSFLYTTMSREKHLYILQDVKRITQALGYSHVWPVDEEPWWELPNLVYLAAERENKAEEFRAAVFQARWEAGENIHEASVLRQLLERVGLESSLVDRAPTDSEIRERAVQIALRWDRDGVFGVPFLIRGFHKFWGVDRLESFLAVLRDEPVLGFSRESLLSSENLTTESGQLQQLSQRPHYDTDTAGGCG